MIAAALASAAEALNSPHLEPVEKNQILSAVVGAVKPNQDVSEVVLSLRPFKAAQGRILMRRF
jgi:hypothetical protein